MKEFFKRFTLSDIIISLCFILIGVLMMTKPEFIQNSIAILFGGIFVVIGIMNLIKYFYDKRQDSYLFAMSVISILFGIIIMFCTTFILSMFRIIIAVWIIFTGIMNLHRTIIWRTDMSRLSIVSLIVSVLMIIGGIIILVNSGSILQTIGLIVVIYGILNIVENVMFIKKVDDYIEIK